MQALPLPRSSAADEPEPEEDEDASEAAPSRPFVTDAARVRSLVLDHNAFVWRSLVRLGVPRSDAEDALQQVFMVATRRVTDIQHGAERSFLYGVCLRVASRARRTLARRREVVGTDVQSEPCGGERADSADRPDELLDRARARALLDEILSTMPLELRSVFTLFELEQLTMSEISDLMGIPQGTVASRLRRARELFAEHRRRIEVRMQSKTARALRAAGSAPAGRSCDKEAP